MPLLHEALVEVHKEYAKANRAAKDMADMYKKATAATEILNAVYGFPSRKSTVVGKSEGDKRIIEENNGRSIASAGRSAQEWQQKCQQDEDALKQIEARAVLLENRTKTLEEQHLAQTELGNHLTEKDNIITGLRRQSAHKQDEV